MAAKPDCRCGCAPLSGFNHVDPPTAPKSPVPHAGLCRYCGRELTARELKAGLRMCAKRDMCLARAVSKALPPVRKPTAGQVAAAYRATGLSAPSLPAIDVVGRQQWEYQPSGALSARKARVLKLARKPKEES